MRKAKIIYHLSFQLYKTEEVAFKKFEELECYVNIRVGELARYADIPKEKISVNIEIKMTRK